jgi:glutamate synthase domain-containing protein 3
MAFTRQRYLSGVEGDAADYTGKGLSGSNCCPILLRMFSLMALLLKDHVVVGNVSLYWSDSAKSFP